MKMPSKSLVVIALAAGVTSFGVSANAAPITAPSLLQNMAGPSVETVQ